MTKNDYRLLINICEYALRKGSDLNHQQVSDIDHILKKLYNKYIIKDGGYALVDGKKMGKRTGV